MRGSVFSTQGPIKPESLPSSEQRLASAVNLAGSLIPSSSRHPWLSTPLLSGSLVAEVYPAKISRLVSWSIKLALIYFGNHAFTRATGQQYARTSCWQLSHQSR